MNWTPISGQPVAYRTDTTDVPASGYYLKAYVSGTTTAISFATNQGGGTTLDKSQLDSAGYPTTDGTTRFIPHVNQTYKLVLYLNATDADNNTVGNADWVIDDIPQSAASTQLATRQKEYQLGSQAVSRVFTLTNSYTLGNENLEVRLNGNPLRMGSSFDYTETSTNSVTLTYDPLDNDVYSFVTTETTTSSVADAAGITYTPAGSGALATNVQAELRKTYYSSNYSTLQEALTAAAGNILCIDANVTTTGANTIPANTEVYSLADILITHNANSNCLYINAVDNVFLHKLNITGTGTFANTSEILIRVGEQVDNIYIDKCKLYNSGRNAISVQQNAAARNPTNVHISNCNIYNNQGNGIFFNGVYGGSITNNYIYDNGKSEGDASNVGYGVVIDAYWDNDPRDIVVSGNHIESNSQGGIIALASKGVVITNNTLADNGNSTFVDAGNNYGNGIYIRWKDSSSDNRTINSYPIDTVISNNEVRGSYGHGIKCENGEGYTVTGNVVKDSGLNNTAFDTYGILVYNTGSNIVKSIAVNGNVVKALTAGSEMVDGIRLKGCQYGSACNNHVYDCTTYGINLLGDATVLNRALTVTGNQVFDDNVITDAIIGSYLEDSIISNNQIYNPLTYGITLDANSQNVRLADNQFNGVTAGNEYNISDIDSNEWVQDWVQTGVYDFAVDGGTTGYKVIGSIPDNCYIVEAWYEVITAMTSGGAATVEIGIITDDTTAIAANAAYNDASYSSGLHNGVPDGTVANFSTKTTAARSVTLRIQGADLTAGKVRVYWKYIQSE